MLPPIPSSLVPVVAQQDVPGPRPVVPPVTAVAPTAEDARVEVDPRHPREGFAACPRWKGRQSATGDPAEEPDDPVPDDSLGDERRLGRQIDIRI